jgi:hypothetical protein
MGSLLAFEIKKIEDYKEMCVAKGLPFDKEVFEEYLDLVYQDMADRFMQVNNRRKNEKVSDNS